MNIVPNPDDPPAGPMETDEPPAVPMEIDEPRARELDQGILLKGPNGADFATPSNAVNEQADSEGFRITHRSKTGIAFEYPNVRDSGFQRVRKEKFREYGKFDAPWFRGTVKTSREKTEIRLFEDFAGRTSTINPKWKMQPEPTGEDEEWTFGYTFPGKDDRLVAGRVNEQKILRSLGFRPPHPSFFLLSVSHLFAIRRLVLAGLLKDHKVLRRTVNIANRSAEGDSFAVVREAAEHACRTRRQTLDASGYTVFEGILDKNDGKNEWFNADGFSLPAPNDASHDIEGDIHHFFDHVKQFLPSDEELESGDIRAQTLKTWRNIRNTRSLGRDVISFESRLTSTKATTSTDLEALGKVDEYRTLRSRTYVEVLFMFLVSFLRLKHDRYDYDAEDDHEKCPRIHAPDTGGRFIATAKHCPVQNGHIDYYHDVDSVGKDELGNPVTDVRYPAYFVMLTSDKPTPIWISEGSHRHIFTSTEVSKCIGSHVDMRMKVIPPWSAAVVRGDVVHGGSGGQESNGHWCLRYHMYIARDKVAFVDAINDRPEYKPRRLDIEQ